MSGEAPSTSAFQIRTMHWWDLDAVLSIEQEVFPNTAWSAEIFWSELAGVPENRWYAVAVQGRDILGYVGLQNVGAEGDLQTIARSSSYPRQGIGTALLTATMHEALKRGCSQVFLEVATQNVAAIHLYEKHGFAVIAQRRDYYGRGDDALVMRRRVTSGDREIQ